MTYLILRENVNAPAGWYSDGQNPSTVRWRDGNQWTEHTQPAQPQHPSFRVFINFAEGSWTWWF